MEANGAADVRRQILRSWLRDAHAMEKGAVDNLQRLVRRVDEHPELKAKLQEHLAESQGQVARLEECLRGMGAEPSRLKEAAQRLGGVAEAWISTAAPDQIVKNCLAAYAYEHLEIAAYKELAAAAEECGEPEIKRMCEEMEEQERAFATWLEERLPQVTRAHLQRRMREEPHSGGRMGKLSSAVRENPAPAIAVAAGIGVIAFAAAAARRRAPQVKDLRELYAAELRELISSESMMEKLLEQAAESASHEELRSVLLAHCKDTQTQPRVLEGLLRQHERSQRGRRDQGMSSLVQESQKMLRLLTRPDLRDAGLTASLQRLIHHQIATYGSLAAWARRLGLQSDQQILRDALEAKKRLDERLTEFAEKTANPRAVAAE